MEAKTRRHRCLSIARAVMRGDFKDCPDLQFAVLARYPDTTEAEFKRGTEIAMAGALIARDHKNLVSIAQMVGQSRARHGVT